MPPNAPSPLKKYLTVRISRQLYARLAKVASAAGESVSDVVIELITRHVAHVDLTADELKQIAKDIENASKK